MTRISYTTIARRFEFDAGHRVLGHEGKCANLHGHRYAVLLTVKGEKDKLGRVIDFGKVKEVVGAWIDDKLDHNMLLHKDDPALKVYAMADVFGNKEPFVMPDWAPNPTAENIASVIYHHARHLLANTEVEVVKVRVYETPNCYADYTAMDVEDNTKPKTMDVNAWDTPESVERKKQAARRKAEVKPPAGVAPMRCNINLDSCAYTCPCGLMLCTVGVGDEAITQWLRLHRPHTNGKVLEHTTQDGARAWGGKAPPDTLVEYPTKEEKEPTAKTAEDYYNK